MNEFLSKFSLQNFLRQFYCGVVFFLPLYLFVPWKVHEFFFQSGLCCKQLICIGALACVIGTLIYHLEKNLYSYVIQGIYEWLEERRPCKLFTKCKLVKKCKLPRECKLLRKCILYLKCRLFRKIIIALVVIGLCVLIHSLHLSIGKTILFSILILCMAKLFLDGKVFKTTIISWIIEGSDAKENRDKNRTETDEMQACDPGHGEIAMHDLRSIAGKIAVWSDFIHCTQSCCFAWILGTCFSYWIIERNCCACCAQCMYSKMYWSLIAAFSILFIESAFIDRHRYSFVMEMKRQYKKLFPHSPYVKTETDKH